MTVYAIEEQTSGQEHSRFKIGFTQSQSAKSRLTSLQIGNPRKLKIAWEAPYLDKCDEQIIHQVLACQKERGEWFYGAATSTLIKVARSLKNQEHFWRFAAFVLPQSALSGEPVDPFPAIERWCEVAAVEKLALGITQMVNAKRLMDDYPMENIQLLVDFWQGVSDSDWFKNDQTIVAGVVSGLLKLNEDGQIELPDVDADLSQQLKDNIATAKLIASNR